MMLPTWNRYLLLLCALLLISGCGEKEPRFALLGGGDVRFSELQGKVVLVNYWATWCKPCREEVPILNAFQLQFKEDVVVLGVNFDGGEGVDQAAQVKDMGIEFDVLGGDPKPFLGVASSGVLPETIVIDRRGKFHQVLLGPQSEKDLTLLLSSLMEDIQYNGDH